MDVQIYLEMNFLLVSVLYGAGIVCFYDCFRCLRRVIVHNTFWVALEDLIFWAGTVVLVFSLLYRYNSGSIRGYCILGMGAGMLIYSYTISRLLLFAVTKAANTVKITIRRIVRRPAALLRKSKANLKRRLKKTAETVKISIKGK